MPADLIEKEGRDNVPSLEELRVIAHFPELHDEVHEAGGVFLRHNTLLQQILKGDLVLHTPVHPPLPRGQFTANVDFDLKNKQTNKQIRTETRAKNNG